MVAAAVPARFDARFASPRQVRLPSGGRSSWARCGVPPARATLHAPWGWSPWVS